MKCTIQKILTLVKHGRVLPEFPPIPYDAPDAVAAAVHLLYHGGAVADMDFKAAEARIAPDNIKQIRELREAFSIRK